MLKMLSSNFFLPTKNFRYLSVLLAVHHNPDISQHGIAQEVDMSSAMVNGYIKEMKKAGHINVININGRDKQYQLTETGQTMLMAHLMNCSAEIVQLYSNAKQELVKKLKTLNNVEKKHKVVLFGGADTAELVVSALEQLPSYSIVAIVDNNRKLWGERIRGGFVIQNPEIVSTIDLDCVIIATFARQNEIFDSLKYIREKGVDVIRLSAL